MVQTFTFPVSIALLPDPSTGLPRRMHSPNVRILTIAKEIVVTWHIETTDLQGDVSVTTEDQVANNLVLIDLQTQALMTKDEYEAAPDPKPQVMGEYDYWNYANSLAPFPVMQQILDAGRLYAIRRGYLTPSE